MSLLPLLARWAHILAAVVAVGGAIYLRVVLLPAARATLGAEEHDRLRAALMPRWRAVVHTCIALLLVSGLYNYLVLMRPEHVGQPLYHAVFGVKFLLALAVFTLAIGLTSSGSLFAALHARRARWLSVLVALAVCVILLSGVLRALPRGTPPPAEPSALALQEGGPDPGESPAL